MKLIKKQGEKPISKDWTRDLENLGVLTERLRPQVMEKLRQKFLVEHGENCPACQKLKDQEPE